MTSILPPPPTSALSPASVNSATDSKKGAVESMAADFEAIFVRNMLSAMRTSSLGDGLFEGKGLEQFRDMQDAQLADVMADKGVFGIAQLLTRHLENK